MRTGNKQWKEWRVNIAKDSRSRFEYRFPRLIRWRKNNQVHQLARGIEGPSLDPLEIQWNSKKAQNHQHLCTFKTQLQAHHHTNASNYFNNVQKKNIAYTHYPVSSLNGSSPSKPGSCFTIWPEKATFAKRSHVKRPKHVDALVNRCTRAAIAEGVVVPKLSVENCIYGVCLCMCCGPVRSKSVSHWTQCKFVKKIKIESKVRSIHPAINV